MGLDSVEILVKVEQTFGITIPDQEAEKIITVGDFHNTVWRHLEGQYSIKCKSQALFYSLRQSFFDRFNFPKAEFTLNLAPDDIFPKENRRALYAEFAAANQIELPDLVLTKPWRSFLEIIALITILGTLLLSIILINFFDNSKWTLLIPVAGAIFTYFFSEILNPKRIIIEEVSVRDFTQRILSLNYAALVKDKGINRKEVEMVINHTIADMMGLELIEVTPDKKLGDDLGVD